MTDTSELRHRSTNPRARVIYVMTAGRSGCGTGVETHVNAVIAYARRHELNVSRLTAHDAPKTLFYPYFGIGRLLKPFSSSLWVEFRQHSHYHAALNVLRQRLSTACSRAIVYAQDAMCARAAVDARDAGLRAEVVCIVHSNGSEADDLVASGSIREGGRLYERIRDRERQLLRRLDRIIFPSRYVADRWLRHGPLAEGTAAYCIPNFAFDPPQADGRLQEARGDLITIGRLDERKNHEFILRVLAAACRRGHPYRLTIVGDGPLADRLQVRAAELGVGGRVTFAGVVPAAATLLRQHRVYVHAARVENCPIVLLEAMAAGRPILAAPAGGVPELFVDGDQGMHWSLDDGEDAAGKLIHVLETPDVYARMSRASRRHYESRFAPDVVGPQILSAVLGVDAFGACTDVAPGHCRSLLKARTN